MDSFSILSVVFLNQRNDLKFVFKFRKICKKCKLFSEEWLTELLEIDYLYNVDIAQFRNLRKLKCSIWITDEQLKQLPHIVHLDICGGINKITDAGIKHLKLEFLDASDNSNITNNGIQNMPLHTLRVAGGWSRISDAGIKHFNLHTLDARGNKRITDVGIKDMKLQKLYASWNKKITDEGIKRMQLTTLYAYGNYKITSAGIAHMPNCTLYK